jgi:cytochrome c biogenesis factor
LIVQTVVRENHPDTLLLMTTDPAKQERMRSIVSTLLYIEGAIVLSLGIWMGVMGITHENREILPLLGVLLFSLGGGLGLLACGRAFAERKNWGRGPAVLANLIALGVARYQFQGDFLIGAVPLLILSLTVLYLAIAIVPQGKEK